MTKFDLDGIVKLHQKAFQGFFLEQDGRFFFIKAYYNVVLEYQGSIAYVYVGKNNSIEGFVVGFVEPATFYKKFIRSSLQFVLPTLLAIIQNPKLLIKIFENISRVISSKTGPNSVEEDKYTAELSSIAVNSYAKGTGSLLTKAFVKDVWSRGLKNITLTTDYEDNDLVNSFYIKQGFKKGMELKYARDENYLVLY